MGLFDTKAYQVHAAEFRSGACDEVIEKLQAISPLEEQISRVEASINGLEAEVATEFQALTEAKKSETVRIESDLADLDDKLVSCTEDLSRVEKELGEVRAGNIPERFVHQFNTRILPVERELRDLESKLRIELDEVKSRIDHVVSLSEAKTAELAQLADNLEDFANDKVPPYFDDQLDDSLSSEERILQQELDAIGGQLESKKRDFGAKGTHLDKLETDISGLASEVHELSSNKNSGLINKLSSSAWWKSHGRNPQEKLTRLKTERENVIADRGQLAIDIEQLSTQFQRTSEAIPEKLSQARTSFVANEFEMQRAAHISLETNLKDLSGELFHLQSEHEEILNKLGGASEQSSQNISEIRFEELGLLAEKLNEEELAQQRKRDCLERDQKQKSTELLTLRQDLDQIEDDQKSALNERKERLVDVVQSIRIDIDSLDESVASICRHYGIAVQLPYSEAKFASLKAEFQAESRMVTWQEVVNSSPPSATIGLAGNQDELEEPDTILSGNLYLDFDGHREEGRKIGKRDLGNLGDQLESIRRKHGQTFFPSVPESDLLEAFIENFFPEQVPQLLYLSNLSLRQREMLLSVRPQIIGPRLGPLLPPGVSLAVKGYLHDNRRDADNPIVRIQEIVDISDSPGRDFEQSISASIYVNESVFPANKRRSNLLSVETVEGLPEISKTTRNRLQDWKDYLQWKETVIQKGLRGVRYTDRECTEDGYIRFTLISASKESFERSKRELTRGNDIAVYDDHYSTSKEKFAFNPEYKGRGKPPGDFLRLEEIDIDSLLAGVSEEESIGYACMAYYQPFPKESKDSVELGDDDRYMERLRSFSAGLPETGYLAMAGIGERILLWRQRDQLNRLQEQSGYSPFLSSYLFDIENANVPENLIEIEENAWAIPSLNEDQRLAVRKMVSTPDIGLVQGPPGTGKTTMIAEAIYQFTRQGKSVLVASQANLAVDNVLERLPVTPLVRPMRLGSKVAEGSDYARERWTDTFYNSLLHKAKQDLAVFDDMGAKELTLNQIAKDVDHLNTEIDQDQSVLRELDEEIIGIRGDIASTKRSIADQHIRESAIASLKEFKNALARGQAWRSALNERLLTAADTWLVEPIRDLQQAGLAVDSLRYWASEETSARKSQILSQILEEVARICSLQPRIEQDLETLRSVDTEAPANLSADGISVAALEAELADVTEKMKGDVSLVHRWQELSALIESAGSSGASFDRQYYLPVLATHDREALDGNLLQNNEQTTAQWLRVLTGVSKAIVSVEAALKEGRGKLLDLSEDELNSLEDVTQLDGALEDLSSRLAARSELRREVVQRISHKFTRAAHLLSEVGISPDGNKMDNNSLIDCRVSLQSKLAQSQIESESKASFRELWQPVLKDWAGLLQDPSHRTNDSTIVSELYQAGANVVGVSCNENPNTLATAGHSRFDVVIIDEVSKANPTEIIMPVMLGRTAILVGDHRQLPPLFEQNSNSYEEILTEIEEDNPESQGDEGESGSEINEENFVRFEKMVTASLFKEHFEKAPDPLRSFVFTQYRMHPQIMQVINQFYEDRLNCGLEDPNGLDAATDSAGLRLHGLQLTGSSGDEYVNEDLHVCWIDSSRDPRGAKSFESRDGMSKTNRLESAVIARVVRDIESAYSKKGYGSEGVPRKKVGVVTFYNGQARLIRQDIKQEEERNGRFRAIEYDVNTVDRYQGQERPIVIVSMVRNPSWKLSARANTAQFERINVAFSRAQELLIVTGAVDTFSGYPVNLPYLDKPGKRKVEVYKHIIDKIKRMGGFRTTAEVIPVNAFSAEKPQKSGAKSKKQRSNRRSGRGKA